MLACTGASRIHRQRGQGHDAAFTPVVGTQNQQHVFQRDDHHQTPEDCRHCANQVGCIRSNLRGRAKNGLHGVQRTGANVTVHHAHCTQCECRKTIPAGCLTHDDPLKLNKRPLSPQSHQERISTGFSLRLGDSQPRFQSANDVAQPDPAQSWHAVVPCKDANNACAR
ncbi:hypothetical protein GALL_456150 [mine drainage metagenome]|uniref:Uncharacterized protein n=1 Tax=mine drainage metagenome TaxID=410659 RepID=A0A1J5PMM2_9ZZZZ